MVVGWVLNLANKADEQALGTSNSLIFAIATTDEQVAKQDFFFKYNIAAIE